uniref:Uncharacterized protein n=1 Tax=Molossus molossus TaxID=27622 RepID=A0A7J8FSV2_MOLMO|nr:hypothetical protein HJG59_008373 [Molossus molossus]
MQLKNLFINFDPPPNNITNRLLTGSLSDDINSQLAYILCCMYYIQNYFSKVNYRKENVVKKIIGKQCRRGPRICLLLQQCLGHADSGTPLLPASDHPPTSFPVIPFRATSAILSLWHQPLSFFISLPNHHELPNPSELFHQGGGCCQPPGHPASVGPLNLPLPGLLFPPQQRGPGPLLPRAGAEGA